MFSAARDVIPFFHIIGKGHFAPPALAPVFNILAAVAKRSSGTIKRIRFIVPTNAGAPVSMLSINLLADSVAKPGKIKT